MGTSPKNRGGVIKKIKLSLYFRGTSEAEGVNTPCNNVIIYYFHYKRVKTTQF